MEFVISHGILPIYPLNHIKFVLFFANIKKFRKSVFSDLFCKVSRMQNLSQEMVMENQELVMEKSWVFLKLNMRHGALVDAGKSIMTCKSGII